MKLTGQIKTKTFYCRRCHKEMAIYKVLFYNFLYCDNNQCIVYGYLTLASITQGDKHG